MLSGFGVVNCDTVFLNYCAFSSRTSFLIGVFDFIRSSYHAVTGFTVGG